MIGNSMSARLRPARRRALWTAASAAILILMAPAARAQFFFNLFEPPAVRVAHQLEVEGYDVRGLVRRGDVYIADVVAQGGDRERLVIDARTSHSRALPVGCDALARGSLRLWARTGRPGLVGRAAAAS